MTVTGPSTRPNSAPKEAAPLNNSGNNTEQISEDAASILSTEAENPATVTPAAVTPAAETPAESAEADGNRSQTEAERAYLAMKRYFEENPEQNGPVAKVIMLLLKMWSGISNYLPGAFSQAVKRQSDKKLSEEEKAKLLAGNFQVPSLTEEQKKQFKAGAVEKAYANFASLILGVELKNTAPELAAILKYSDLYIESTLEKLGRNGIPKGTVIIGQKIETKDPLNAIKNSHNAVFVGIGEDQIAAYNPETGEGKIYPNFNDSPLAGLSTVMVLVPKPKDSAESVSTDSQAETP